jgi:CHAT domain-containing protein/tetratricopeptide (TPR) repeat protein
MIASTERQPCILKRLSICCLAIALVYWPMVLHGNAETTPVPQRAKGGAAGNETPDGLRAGEHLEPGKPIERALTRGEKHAYRVILKTGQFLRVVVRQQGIDVVVTLSGPAGNRIVLMDCPNGSRGPEPVLTIAQVDGSHQIEVEWLDMEKSIQSAGYEIRMQDLRPATPQDIKSVAAWLALSEANELSRKGTAESCRRAVPKYYEAVSGMLDIGDTRGRAYALYGLGFTYTDLNEHQKALEHQIQALAIVQTLEDRFPEASLLSSIGLTYSSTGEYQKALDHHALALSAFQAVGSSWGEATALNNMSLVYDSLGEHRQALAYYNRALTLRRTVGDRSGEAVTLNNIGAAHRALGEHHKALDHYYQALTMSRAVKLQKVESYTLNNIGFVRSSLGDEQTALDYYKQALSVAQAIGDLRGQAIALKNIGSVYVSFGDGQRALDSYHDSLQHSISSKDRSLEAITRYLIARQQFRQYNLIEARSNIETAIEIAESLRTKVVSPELRVAYFASVQQYYDLYIDLLMSLDQLNPDRGHAELALHASERARARTLLEMLAEAHADIRHGVEPALLERERSLNQSLDAKTERQSRFLSLNGNKKEIELLGKEIEQLLVEDKEVKARIREKSPRYAALTQPRPMTLKEIQLEIVDPNTLLLEYALGERHSYLWAVTHDSMFTFQLPKRAEIEKAAQRVYQLLSTDDRQAQRQKRPSTSVNSYREAVSALSRILLGPVAAHLQEKCLLIVAQGALSYIPFGALPLPDLPDEPTPDARRPTRLQTLIAKHEIIHLPSVSVLAVLRRETAGRELPPNAVAVVADPVFSKRDVRLRSAIKKRVKAIAETGGREAGQGVRTDSVSRLALGRSAREVGLGDGRELPRLPHSRQEAQAILSLGHSQGALGALDFDASRETATSPEMARYRIVHFATHGILNNEHPELSGLVFSLVDKHGNPRDGFLRLYNIYNLNLEADLVVLSACQTALGKQINGEGLMGVTRGFMYAGASRVVASLWKVDDAATAELMKKFYSEMIKVGRRPADALRVAQLWMQKQERWRAPYYWAGFILQGEWR